MEIKDLKRPELRETIITIRTFPSYATWLKKKGISPSKLFNKSIEELMEKSKEKK